MGRRPGVQSLSQTINTGHILVTLFIPTSSLSATAATSPQYIGQESREITALAASEVIDLLADKGMGLARAAELKGYPGPMHVLELRVQQCGRGQAAGRAGDEDRITGTVARYL